MKATETLHERGQSPWLDNMTRGLLDAEGNWRWRCTNEMLPTRAFEMAARPDEHVGSLARRVSR